MTQHKPPRLDDERVGHVAKPVLLLPLLVPPPITAAVVAVRTLKRCRTTSPRGVVLTVLVLTLTLAQHVRRQTRPGVIGLLTTQTETLVGLHPFPSVVVGDTALDRSVFTADAKPRRTESAELTKKPKSNIRPRNQLNVL